MVTEAGKESILLPNIPFPIVFVLSKWEATKNFQQDSAVQFLFYNEQAGTSLVVQRLGLYNEQAKEYGKQQDQ